MNLKKNKILYVSAALGCCIIFFIALKIYYSLKYPQEFIKKEVSSLINTSLNRAVQYENLSINYSGDIVLTSFDLSASSDFNDNISLIKAPKMVIDLDFIDLMKGQITIRGFNIRDAEFRFLKSYGKDYHESFSNIVDLAKRILQIASVNKGSFSVIFKGCTARYEEIFKDENITILMDDIFSSIVIDGNTVDYSFKVRVSPRAPGVTAKGHIKANGQIVKDSGAAYSHDIELDNIDLTYFNRFIEEKSPYVFTLKGATSMNCLLKYEKNIYTVNAEIEANNLHLYPAGRMNNPLVSNENINITADFSYDSSLNKFILKNGELDDGIIKLETKGTYVDNESENKLEGSIATNSVDLEDMTHYFMPLENMYYGGEFSFKGDFHYDIKNNDARRSTCSLKLKDFTLHDITRGSEKTLVKKSDLSIVLKDNSIRSVFTGKAGSSDYRFTMNTEIMSWNPLKSVTESALYSKKMECSLIYDITSSLLDAAVREAAEDARRGFEDVYFLQKPVSQLVINNDCSFEFNADLLSVNKKQKQAGFKNFTLGLEMKRGVLTLKDFTIRGYNGIYTADLQGYFATDFPHFTITGSVRDFDLSLFSKDINKENHCSGIASFDFDYELNCYRISQILSNNKSNMRFFVSQGVLVESVFLQDLKTTLKKSGVTLDAENSLAYNNISLTAQQYGEDIYVRNFSLNGDALNCNLSGKYSYREGLNLSGGLKLRTVEKQGEVELKRETYAPITMKGPLTGPCAEMKIKKENVPFCF